jgi:hypothetical protein
MENSGHSAAIPRRDYFTLSKPNWLLASDGARRITGASIPVDGGSKL